MAFKYRGADRAVESVSKRAKQSGGSFDSYLVPEASFFKSREGDCSIRILPSTWIREGHEDEDIAKYGDGWELQIWLHRNVGPDNGTYLCTDKMKQEPCAICDARRDMTDEDEADALKPKWRAICYVIDRDDEKAGPQIMSMPITLFREINSRSVDRKTGKLILIDDPEEGYDVLFTREGTGIKTNYKGVELDRDFSPIHDDQAKQKRWLDYISDNPLPELLVYFAADHVEKVLFGQIEKRKSRDAEDGDARPARRSRGGSDEEPERQRRRGREEPDSNDAEEPEDGARSRRRAGRAEPEPEPETRPRRSRGDVEEPERPRRGSREEPEPEPETRPRRGSREEPEPEPEERPRRSRAEPEPEPEEGGKVARRRGAAAEEESPSTQARSRLGRLKDRE